jgi:hypothetical protein
MTARARPLSSRTSARYLQTFATTLRKLSYDGPLAAQVSFDDVAGVSLGIGLPYVAPHRHPIEEASIRGRLWHYSTPQELIGRPGRSSSR